MIQTILGAAVLLIPFLLIFNFQDRVRGFLYISASVVSAHALIALLTQAFHVFSYGIVIGIHAVVAVICIALFLYHKKFFSNLKFNWLIFAVVAMVGYELSSAHYFYKGIVSDIGGLNAVSRDYYPYPHYSDEWVGVSLADYSISQKSLPLVNPLWKNEPFANGLAAFYSLASELFLLLNLSPLTSWSFFAVMNGLIISLLTYLLLRTNAASTFSSALGALSVPLIVNGVNVAGIWFFAPHVFALTIFLLMLVSFSRKEFRIGTVLASLCIILYPPFVVFVLPALLACMASKKLSKYHLLLIAAAGVVVAGLLSIVVGYSKALQLIFSWIIRPNLDGGIISLPIWIIVPIMLLPFVILGLAELVKRKLYVVLAPISAGLFFWALYSVSLGVIIIDQSRVVALTAILLMIPAGFGVERAIIFFKDNKYMGDNRSVSILFKASCFLAFVSAAFFYPGSNSWSRFFLKIRTEEGASAYSPSAPIARWLHQDDLRLFSGISEKTFLSPPWKGLVIGAATRNYPLDSKASTVTNRFLRYSDFMESSCDEKAGYVRKFGIDYIYGAMFECDGFVKIGSSEENLHLYKHISRI